MQPGDRLRPSSGFISIHRVHIYRLVKYTMGNEDLCRLVVEMSHFYLNNIQAKF
jgi:hypothetical protein